MPRGVYERKPRTPQAAPQEPTQPKETLPAQPQPDRPATDQLDGKGNGCEGCPGRDLHGLNVAEVMVVEQAVMAGLSIEAASKILRQAQAAGR